MKVCKECQEEKPLDKFRKYGVSTVTGQPLILNVCKTCNLLKEKKRIEGGAVRKDPREREGYREAKENSRMLYLYKMTLTDYYKMLSDQGDACKVCKVSAVGVNKRFPVDHDHSCCPGRRSCGECVRGILCDVCNNVLGRVEDSPSRLKALADYLIETKKHTL